MVESVLNSKQETSKFSERKEDDSGLGNIDLLNLRLFPDENSGDKNEKVPKTSKSILLTRTHLGAGDSYTRAKQRHPLESTKATLVPNINKLPRGYESDYKRSNIPSDHLILLYSKKNRGLDYVSTKPRSGRDFLLPTRKKAQTQLTDLVPEDKISKPISQNNKIDSGFPFKYTPSGNLKINSSQVVFSTNKLSVLIADPEATKVSIHQETNCSKKMANDTDLSKTSAMDTIMSQAGFSSLGTLIGNTPVRVGHKEASEYETKQTSQILEPEINLGRIGITDTEKINWHTVGLPEKKNLYLELYSRITNYTNADCKVYIDNEEFNCHLIVLQCYSEVFDGYIAVKKVELPSEKCSAAAFSFIYEWMITGEPSCKDLTRENVLDIFNSAKYLKIQDLVEQCWAFIDHTDVFSEETSFLLYLKAKNKNLPEVRELMLPRIQGFFLMLVSTQDWLELELDDVKNLLKSNYICVNCEMEVFMSAVRWLKHDWAAREQHKYEIMECIRFGNIAPWQLVDIKRNPENPDFLELAQDQPLCKMIDDGLAYVIIKYWYGQENEDFQHWNAVLGLKEPPPRNWSGNEKTYFTYREFLIYLDQHRRNKLIEKQEKVAHRAKENKDQNSASGSAQKNSPRVPSMEEFLTKKKLNEATFPIVNEKELDPTSSRAWLSRPQAATIIQRAYRKFRKQKLLKNLVVDRMKKKSVLKKTKKGVLNMFNLFKNHFEDQKHVPVVTWFRTGRNLLEVGSLFDEIRETILVFGGLDPHNPYGFGKNTGKGIYRYMPIGNYWEIVGEIPEPRHHQAAEFYKGKIFLVGGSDPRGNQIFKDAGITNTAWSFDPVTKKWLNEGPLNTARKNFGLVACSVGLYAIGGQGNQYQVLDTVEKYDVENRRWQQMQPMLTARTGFASVKYKNHIWVAGGISGGESTIDILDSIETYDIRSNQWTELKYPLRFPRCFSSMFVLSNKLYLIGGAGKSLEISKGSTMSIGAVDVWDDKRLEWTEMAQLNIARHGHAVSYLGTQILIVGGVTTAYGRALSNTECFCTQRGTWVRGLACLPTPLAGHAIVTLPPASLLTI